MGDYYFGPPPLFPAHYLCVEDPLYTNTEEMFFAEERISSPFVQHVWKITDEDLGLEFYFVRKEQVGTAADGLAIYKLTLLEIRNVGEDLVPEDEPVSEPKKDRSALSGFWKWIMARLIR